MVKIKTDKEVEAEEIEKVNKKEVVDEAAEAVKGQKLEETSTKIIDDANAAADRIEEANKETEKNIIRQENLKAQEILGGRADGVKEEKSAEEEALESAKDLIRGTGLEDDAFPPKKK